MKRSLLLAALAPMLMAQAKPTLVPDISARSIQIRYSFSGAQLLMFGAILYPGGKVIAAATRDVEIEKAGTERYIALAARQHGFLYGLASVLLSLGLGWAAAMAFRRRA